MFIIIDEEGTVFQASRITEADYCACDAGLISIVDPVNKQEYIEDEWVKIKRWQQRKAR